MQMRIKELSHDFQTVFAMIKPLSAYGRSAHQTFEMFQRGEEEQLVAYLHQVAIARTWLTKRANRTKIDRLLRKVDNIDGYLDQVMMEAVDDLTIFQVNRLTNVLAELHTVFRDLNTPPISLKWESVYAVKAILKLGNQHGEGFYLADDYDPELARLRMRLRELERRYHQELRRYLAPVAEFLARDLREHFTISTQQTDLQNFLIHQPQVAVEFQNEIAIGYRVIDNPLLKDLKEERLQVEQDLRVCISQNRLKIAQRMQKRLVDYPQILTELGIMDVLLARAKVADRFDCVTPEISDDFGFEMVEGRHILLEQKLKGQQQTFTPRTIKLQLGSALLTGINMGGKTVTLRTIDLLASMAQAGMPVPAQSLKLRLSDFIYFNYQEKDTLLTGLSHFGQEVKGLESVLEQQQECGLVLIDEILHGTAPIEGEALATVYLDLLHHSACVCIASTHFTGIVEELDVPKWRIRGINQEALQSDGDAINFGIRLSALSKYIDYSIVPHQVSGNQLSETFAVARLLGVDLAWIERAQELIDETDRQQNGGK